MTLKLPEGHVGPNYPEIVFRFHSWLNDVQQAYADSYQINRKEVYYRAFLTPKEILDKLGGLIMDVSIGDSRTFIVTSDTDPSKTYEVREHPGIGVTCTCTGFIYRNKCKHQQRIRDFLAGSITAQEAGIASEVEPA